MTLFDNSAFQNSWNNYFQNTAPGTVTNFPGVTATMGEGGNALLKTIGNGDQTFNVNAMTNPADIASWAPGIGNAWQDMFGNATNTTPTTPTLPTNTLDIPTDLYGTSTSAATSGSSGLSGIDWNSDIAKALLPQLISTGQALPGLADSMRDTLQSRYSNLMRNALGPGAFQGTLNQLANRGMVNSTTGENALANTARNAMTDVANKDWESNLAARNAQMQVPSLLANLIELSRQTSNTSQAQSGSYTADPFEPWKALLASLQY